MDSLISGDITAITSICVIYRSSSVKRDLAFTPERRWKVSEGIKQLSWYTDTQDIR